MQSNGAIFQAGQVDNMFADARPYRVGDILTVILEERMQASKSAQTSTGKSQETAITPPNVLGLTGPAIERLNARSPASGISRATGRAASRTRSMARSRSPSRGCFPTAIS